MNSYPFQNLVFKGGGVKGIAYVGALQALEDAQIMSQINGFAGTSAGSIVSALAACRIPAKTLSDFLSQTDYEKFKDKGGFFNYLKDLTENFGAYQGDYFLNDWFKTFLQNQNIDPEITFAEVNANYGTVLKVFSTDLNTQTVQEFSKDITPDVQIAWAVRASMSIPLFFKAWQFPDGNPTNHIYVDGGVMYNYPIDAFDATESNPNQTLGFFLTDLSGIPTPPNNLTFGFTHIETYIKSLFEALMNSQDLMIQKDDYEEKRTVSVDDLGISATDFDITQQQAQALYNSGYNCTKKFLSGFVG